MGARNRGVGEFGLEFATLLARKHANLVLLARRKEPMERLAERLLRDHGIDVVVETLDFSENGAAARLKSRINARRAFRRSIRYLLPNSPWPKEDS